MKKIVKFVIVLMMVFSLFGCTNNQENNNELEKQEINLARKTFFNVYVGFEGEHSNVVFNEDKTFVLNDYYLGGVIEFEGIYEIKDKTVELKVSESGLGEFDKIVFNIINEDVLSLQNKLFDSLEGNIFICANNVDSLNDAIEAQRINVKEIISGKTYYNSVDRYGNTDTSNITLNSDGTFEMKEHYYEEFVSIKGKWEASDYKLHCVVEESGVGEFKEINFYISNYEKLLIESNLFSSQKDDVFTCEEVYITPVETLDFNNYINASQQARGDFGVSNITLRNDGTFTLVETVGMGATQINGLYGREGDVYMFSDFDCSIYNDKGAEVYNFEFHIIDDNTLELMRDLEGSKAGDCFTIDGEIPSNFTPKYVIEKSVYVHEPINDVLNEYLPKIELYSDYTFVVTENVYAGMGQYKGTYSKLGNVLLLNVTDKSSMQGFAGADVDQIALEQSKYGYILCTNLCMSQEGDSFILQ